MAMQMTWCNAFVGEQTRSRLLRRRWIAWLTMFSISFAIKSAFAEAPTSGSLHIPQVFLKILEQVEVPAREAGVLAELRIREGHAVEQGDLLGRVDDTRATLASERAVFLVDQARRHAANELKIKLVTKKLAVARLELTRARDSNRRFPRSVSQSELDRLQLGVEIAELDREQAAFELEEAHHDIRLRESELDVAQHEIERRRISAPFTGTVLELMRRAGEWVEPGQPVARLVRMDRLRAEGLVASAVGTKELVGKPVQFNTQVEGEKFQARGVVVFVSPEVEPVAGRVVIWAEIENVEMRLRPGLEGELVLHP